MKLTPCCNAEYGEYGEYGSLSHSFVACSKCGKSEFSEEIDSLKAELAAARGGGMMEFTLETARWGLMVVGLLIGCIGWQLYSLWKAIERLEDAAGRGEGTR
jgi:hypothetical protein